MVSGPKISSSTWSQVFLKVKLSQSSACRQVCSGVEACCRGGIFLVKLWLFFVCLEKQLEFRLPGKRLGFRGLFPRMCCTSRVTPATSGQMGGM